MSVFIYLYMCVKYMCNEEGCVLLFLLKFQKRLFVLVSEQ